MFYLNTGKARGGGQLAADLLPEIVGGPEGLLDCCWRVEPGAGFHLRFKLTGLPTRITDIEPCGFGGGEVPSAPTAVYRKRNIDLGALRFRP